MPGGICTVYVRRTPNQTENDVLFPDRGIKGNSQKRIEK